MKMFIPILVILSVLHQTYSLETTGQNISTSNSFTCDDEILKNVGEKLAHVVKEKKDLRIKMDTMNSNIDLPIDCTKALQESDLQSGVNKIRIPGSKLEPFDVYCMADADQVNAASWTFIQRRIDGSIDFYRDWVDFKQGFGNLEGEFFLGLDKIHALTQSKLHELWIKLEDFENVTRSAYYSSFAIGGESEAYALNILGSYKGNAGDSLRRHAGHTFTTKDVDNDIHDNANCAVKFTGGWWYHSCHGSNLHGQYLGNVSLTKDMANYGKGIVWNKWQTHKYVHMAIRPVITSK